MRGVKMVVKMNVVLVAITFTVAQMKIDAFCVPNSEGSKTETETGSFGGIFRNNLSLGTIKTTGIAAIAGLAFAFLMSNSKVNAAAVKAPQINYDAVNQATIKLETENFLQKQAQSQSDVEHGELFNNGQLDENIVGDYVPDEIEDMEDWQVEDSEVYDDFGIDYYYNDEFHERFTRDTKLGNYEKKKRICEKYRKQFMKRFGEDILEKVGKKDYTLILKDGQSKRMAYKLKLMEKKKCGTLPVKYNTAVEVNGHKTGEHEYTLEDRDTLEKIAKKYKNTRNKAPLSHMNDGGIILDDNSTSVLNGTNTDYHDSAKINKVTIPTTDSTDETTENPTCINKERELVNGLSHKLSPKLK